MKISIYENKKVNSGILSKKSDKIEIDYYEYGNDLRLIIDDEETLDDLMESVFEITARKKKKYVDIDIAPFGNMLIYQGNKTFNIDFFSVYDNDIIYIMSCNELKDKIKKLVQIELNNFIPVMSCDEEYSVGNGTEESPYIIDIPGKLKYFSNQINKGKNSNAYYALGADIDLGEIEWIPIGVVSYKGFNGYFDGRGYEVSNYVITSRLEQESAEGIGLFGFNNGKITNVGVKNYSIDMSWNSKFGSVKSVNVGGLAGDNEGIIENCYSIGKINLEHYGTITGNGTVCAPAHVFAGGLVGCINDGRIKYCFANVDIKVIDDSESGTVSAAGIAGGGYNGGIIENCLVIGNIYADELSSNGNCDVFDIGRSENNCFVYNESDQSRPYHCTEEKINTIDFYINKIGWDKTIWNLESINFSNGKYNDNKYPRLFKIR